MAGTRTEVSNSSSFTYSSGAGTSTFSSMSLGTADADRVIVAACTWERHPPTACTINGVTATQVVTADSGTVSVSQLWVAEVPTGTSGDVVFTVPGNASFGACTLWRSTDIDATADDSDSDASVGAGSGGNTTLNVPAGGVVFAASYLRTAGTATWTGPTEDYAVTTNGRDNSHASSEEASADATFDCDVSWSGSSNVSVVSAVFPEAAGGGTAYTLNADAGVFAITGAVADLQIGYALDANAGTFTITGADATLIYGTVTILDAEAGSFTITGTAANLEYGRSIAADAGTFTITGADATLTYNTGVTLSAEAGTFTITGADATLTYTQPATLAAEAGVFWITGTAATLAYDSLAVWVDQNPTAATWTAQADSGSWTVQAGTAATWTKQ